MRVRIIIIVVFLFHIIIFTHCQDRESSFILGIRPHYGFIVKHSGKLEGLTKTFPWGIEVDANWQLMSEKSWQYCFCYPRVGLSFYYTNFANPEILGSSYALYPFVEPAINGDRKLHATVRFGMGPVFMDNVFDSVNNPENKFYSSHISFIVHANLGINYIVNERVFIRISGDFNHISNGGIKNPNLGINFPSASIGFEYNFNPLPYLVRSKDKSVKLIHYNHRFDFTFFATGKTAVKGHERYTVYGFSQGFSYVIGRQHALSIGSEFTVDLADRKEIRKDTVLINSRFADHRYIALLAGHELILGRFNFYQQLGVYIYSPFIRKDPVYQRYGLNFNITKNNFVGISIKA
ncbi:MAG: acyloxyacyl hydrolase, partial [Bacteroidales bacterium]